MESATTTELTLPGLAAPEVAPELDTTHWLERTPQKRLMLFAGRSNPDLAEAIAKRIDDRDAGEHVLLVHAVA